MIIDSINVISSNSVGFTIFTFLLSFLEFLFFKFSVAHSKLLMESGMNWKMVLIFQPQPSKSTKWQRKSYLTFYFPQIYQENNKKYFLFDKFDLFSCNHACCEFYFFCGKFARTRKNVRNWEKKYDKRS